MPTVVLPTLVAHAAAALFIAGVSIAAWFWLRWRFGLAWRDIGVGAVALVVFALVLERTLHLYLLQLNPTTAHWLRMPTLFAIYDVLVAGVFEQSRRWTNLRFLARKPGDAATPVAYALKYAGTEAWLVGAASQAQMVIFGLVTDRGELKSRLAANGAFAVVGMIHAMFAQLSPQLALGVVSEHIAAMLIQFTLTLVIWHAIRQRHFVAVMLAVLLHALADLPTALHQVCILPLAVTEAIYVMAAVLLTATY